MSHHNDPSNPKGKVFGGECNRTACDHKSAEWWNYETNAFYCRTCASAINRGTARRPFVVWNGRVQIQTRDEKVSIMVAKAASCPDWIYQRLGFNIKFLLTSERDCYKTWLSSGRIDKLPEKFHVGPLGGGYYTEAFGIARAITLLNLGYFGADNTPANKINTKWWFYELCDEVIEEEKKRGIDGNYVYYGHCLRSLIEPDVEYKLRERARQAVENDKAANALTV